VLKFSSLGPAIQNTIFIFASLISTALLVLSAWAMAANWDMQYSKSFQAQMENAELAKFYKELAKTELLSFSEYKAEIARLDSMTEKVDHLCMELRVTDQEKRMGMRSGLREFQRECVKCKQIPSDILSTNCDICGNFKRRRL
jgi:mobilome CxxCx(11)CxxC protein